MLSRRHRGSSGSVAVEFALMASLVLLPLFLGGADFVQVLSAQAQLNCGLQSLFYFAYANPAQAATGTDISAVVTKINALATHSVYTSGATGTLSYDCLTSTGTTTSATAGSTCSSGTKREFVTYQLSTRLTLPLPMPIIGTTISSAGTVQID